MDKPTTVTTIERNNRSRGKSHGGRARRADLASFDRDKMYKRLGISVKIKDEAMYDNELDFKLSESMGEADPAQSQT